MDDIEALNYDDLEAVAKLSSSARYKDIMQVGFVLGGVSRTGAVMRAGPWGLKHRGRPVTHAWGQSCMQALNGLPDAPHDSGEPAGSHHAACPGRPW